MGTRVQHTSYLQTCCTMRDLNEDANGYWSQYYEDKASGRKMCNNYQPINGFVDYDKEMLKRTMLEHEAIFRKQVYELHRLYRIQKDMMDELKKGPQKRLQVDILQSNSFSSQKPSRFVTVTDDRKPTLNFLNENSVQSGSVSTEKKISVNDGDISDSNHGEPQKRMFDLQLPAEVYIDCEEEKAGKETVADLNEPCGEICFEKAADSVSSKLPGRITPFAENQGLRLPVRLETCFSGLPTDFLKGRHFDEGTSSNHFCAGAETSRGWPFFNNEAGQSTSGLKLFGPGSSKEKVSISSEQSKRDTWFKPKPEFSERNSLYSYLDYKTSPSPLLSSWGRPPNGYNHVPLAVSSFQCFQGSASLNHGNAYSKWPYSGDLNGYSQSITFGKPNPSGEKNDGSSEHSSSQKSQKDLHLNQTLLNGFRSGFTTEKINESEPKCEDPLEAPSWLKKKPTYSASSLMELDLSQGYPQLRRKETERNINLFNLQDFPSSSQGNVITTKKNLASTEQSSKKIFGFSIPEKTQQAVQFLPHQEQSQIVVTESSGMSSRGHIDLNFDLNLAESEKAEIPSQVSAPTVAFEIDLEAPIVFEGEKQDDASVKEAAESILLISSDQSKYLDDKVPCYNPLPWFAEVVSSTTEIIKESSDDSFEVLTLELEEIRPEEYLSQSWKGLEQKDDDNDDEKSNIASLLFTKPKRGQQRKRRQKRDFQRDILPGLSSLSRHEVIEDLQTIGTLMKASGQIWQGAGLTRSSRGRKPRSLAVTAEEIHVSPPPVSPLPQPAPAVVQLGWGRTTRRCRRQRLPPQVTNVAAPLT
ncbi:uncharacterized protein LOC109848665 [Asparagus officinalis]|nr:uncharacterized protein LOC109848665 [Asparagus officinalis]